MFFDFPISFELNFIIYDFINFINFIISVNMFSTFIYYYSYSHVNTKVQMLFKLSALKFLSSLRPSISISIEIFSLSLLGGSVGWSFVSCNKKLWIWFLVRAHPGGNWLMFFSHINVSLSLSQINKTINSGEN